MKNILFKIASLFFKKSAAREISREMLPDGNEIARYSDGSSRLIEFVKSGVKFQFEKTGSEVFSGNSAAEKEAKNNFVDGVTFIGGSPFAGRR